MANLVYDSIGPTLDFLILHTAEAVTQAMEDGAEKVQAYAQANAPWADQTGAARAGLTAEVKQDSGEIVLELSHGVDYGYWLEVIQDGRFAIIMPTIEALGAEIIRDAGGKVFDQGRNF